MPRAPRWQMWGSRKSTCRSCHWATRVDFRHQILAYHLSKSPKHSFLKAEVKVASWARELGTVEQAGISVFGTAVPVSRMIPAGLGKAHAEGPNQPSDTERGLGDGLEQDFSCAERRNGEAMNCTDSERETPEWKVSVIFTFSFFPLIVQGTHCLLIPKLIFKLEMLIFEMRSITFISFKQVD